MASQDEEPQSTMAGELAEPTVVISPADMADHMTMASLTLSDVSLVGRV
jgi:hypothetical protein